MKIVRAIISIVFIVGTIAIIVIDSRTKENKKTENKTVKTDSLRRDSASHASIKK
jgi:hypothetical protein